jgi:hypothetical protein
MARPRAKKIKRVVELAATVILPFVVITFSVLDHNGTIDRWRGIDLVEEVANRFSLSYADNASAPVYPTDPAWKPTIALIEKYSKIKLRADKTPQTIARVQDPNAKQYAAGFEWTVPATPIAVLYQHWPGNTGKTLALHENFELVGSIGQLQSWIERSKSDFHFLLNDIFLAAMAAILALWQWRLE